MGFRTAAYLKSTANNLRGRSRFTTSAYAPAADHSLPSKLAKGQYVPVYVAVGMIAMSASFGLLTIFHQLGRAPNVTLKKSRRETIPELVEPERVAADGESFIKHSFFRKVAHIQDFQVMDHPIRADVFNRPVRVESLKDVGVDPAAH